MERWKSTAESLQEYERWHEELPVDVESDTPWHRMVKRRLAREDLLGKVVLEIGCGRGGFAIWLADQDHTPRRVVAADFSPTAVAKGCDCAQETGTRRIAWAAADITRVPFPDSTFDTVISCETVEHVPDPRRAVRELARVLRPGGRLFLTTPNYLGPMGAYRAYLRLRGTPYTEGGQPINHFVMLPRTCWWIRRAGLRIESVESDEHTLPLPGGQVRADWMRHPEPVMKWFGLQSMVVARRPS